MAKNIPSSEHQRPATKTTLPSKALNQDRRLTKEFPREKKSKRIHFHQTSSARNAKGTAFSKGRKRKRERERNTGTKKVAVNKYLSIITLNVNGLYTPIKRHRVAEWIRKQDPALAGVAQWIECWLVNQRDAGSIPSRGTCLSCKPGPQ